MLKSFKILVFFALFLSVAKSLAPFDSEKINFAPEPKKTYSYGSESNEDTIVLNFICDDEKLLAMAKDNGIATNEPQKMRESYAKAMEMLKALGMNGVKR